ncbi:hypothetical protein F4803DRAFT_544297 [Xylaria telfairii]|nr:hypothetical protein F4803DRAFT_544297 [Xylaria telfairii]
MPICPTKLYTATFSAGIALDLLISLGVLSNMTSHVVYALPYCWPEIISSDFSQRGATADGSHRHLLNKTHLVTKMTLDTSRMPRICIMTPNCISNQHSAWKRDWICILANRMLVRMFSQYRGYSTTECAHSDLNIKYACVSGCDASLGYFGG